MLGWTNGFGVGLAICAAIGLGALGCSQGGDRQQANAEKNGGSAESGHEHGHGHGHGHKHGGEAGDEVSVTLAKLSADDRAAAERQKICPVSGELLGSMGVPPKVTIEGRDVFICCDGCKDALEADPDEYLAKLAEADRE